MCKHVCVCCCVFLCVYVDVCIHVCVCVCVCCCVFLCPYVDVCICIHVGICVCVCACVSALACVFYLRVYCCVAAPYVLHVRLSLPVCCFKKDAPPPLHFSPTPTCIHTHTHKHIIVRPGAICADNSTHANLPSRHGRWMSACGDL